MSKGIILVDMPENCCRCKIKTRPAGMSFPEDMICGITEQSIYQYKPNNVYGNKPDWCPIKPLPQHKKVDPFPEERGLFSVMEIVNIGKQMGWNACLDEIER